MGVPSILRLLYVFDHLFGKEKADPDVNKLYPFSSRNDLPHCDRRDAGCFGEWASG